jgi:GxxExxY protein
VAGRGKDLTAKHAKSAKKVEREEIGAAIEVRAAPGPGLLESTQERCLMHEWVLQGIKAERQKRQSIHCKDL